jgi:hypothetical protein
MRISMVLQEIVIDTISIFRRKRRLAGNSGDSCHESCDFISHGAVSKGLVMPTRLR